MVNLLPPMMSLRIQIGEDVPEKFDIVVSEVMDLWCLGEGVIATMRHAHKKLLEPDGIMLPSKLVLFAQPIELNLFGQQERKHELNLSPLRHNFRARYSPLRIHRFPHKWLVDEPVPVLQIDLRNVPTPPPEGEPNLERTRLCIRMGGKPANFAKITSATIEHSGILSGYGFWWAADLGSNVLCTAPESPQRSWKQLVRWLDEPRFVQEGEEVQVLACYSDTQVNLEDVHAPRDAVEQCKEQVVSDVRNTLNATQPKSASQSRTETAEDIIAVD